MGFLKEFRDFAVKGNVLDLAIGVIIGAAFGKIISSFVADIVMPPLGLLLGKVDFANMFIVLSSGRNFKTLAEAKAVGAITLNYGNFLMAVIDFVLIALAIFMVISQINRMKKKAPAPEPNTKECPHCISRIPLNARKCAYCTSRL
ncbi:MAG: large-conductance mechanosensitive channel protein MscL [archaeon]